jgi:1-acyl-sn-glycerol-3-phosphate acyltransferase
MEILWFFNVVFVVALLPCIVKTHRRGSLPAPPFILAATHVGELDPPLILRASGRYRMRAIFERDGPEPIVRFLLRAIYRFQVTQRPELKSIVNERTKREIHAHFNRGGTLMIFPEGFRHWEKQLFPGVAVMAHRAGVPIVPTGIERGDVFQKELLSTPLRAMLRAIRIYHQLGHVTVHFEAPIYPDTNLEERQDVDRLMRSVEERFADFYRCFYRKEGPIWVGSSKEV